MAERRGYKTGERERVFVREWKSKSLAEYGMTMDQVLWTRTKDELVRTVEQLGFPAQLGEAVAKHLGSPKAMERMIAYLENVKPRREDLLVDEMLAIRSEMDAWREKKASEEANARYNEILNYGLGTEDDSYR